MWGADGTTPRAITAKARDAPQRQPPGRVPGGRPGTGRRRTATPRVRGGPGAGVHAYLASGRHAGFCGIGRYVARAVRECRVWGVRRRVRRAGLYARAPSPRAAHRADIRLAQTGGRWSGPCSVESRGARHAAGGPGPGPGHPVPGAGRRLCGAPGARR
nr:UL43 frame-shift polypeptide [synthetic construct]WNK89006.1 UL43 frame-shift polypeptide [Human alphaherpesvirus 1]